MSLMKLLVLVGLSVLRPSYATECPARLTAQPSESASPESADNSVELLWYPKAGFFLVSHVELAVNGVAWGAASGFKPKAPLKVAELAAQGKKGKGFFRFQFDLSAEETEALEAFLQDRKYNYVFKRVLKDSVLR